MAKRKNILSINADAKTTKGTKEGYLTGILYLAPAKNSGYETCKYRTEGCTTACLYTAGRGSFSNVQSARIAKTERFFTDRENFWLDLIHSIRSLVRKADREGLIPVVRLNGTSDLPWERMAVVVDGELLGDSVIAMFPNVQFYDYTKWPLDRRSNVPKNYDLTFSLAESNEEHFLPSLNVSRVAVVFNRIKGQLLPSEWKGVPVVDADETDLRFLDPKGVIVGLRAKGQAIKDESGFVKIA